MSEKPSLETGKSDQPLRSWEYGRLGDYHRNLDLNWSYAPTYLSKMRIVRNYFSQVGKEKRILDAGCGEGVLVDEYKEKGLNIVGVDLNYESANVNQGDLRALSYPNHSFDVVLLLDVLEHFEFSDQPIVLHEIYRVLRPEGVLLATMPNLLHWNSRFMSLFFGRLDRADADLDHPGERPLYEYLRLLRENSFAIRGLRGITLTVPIAIKFIRHFPRQLRWMHDLLDRLAVPSLSQFIFFDCVKIAKE